MSVRLSDWCKESSYRVIFGKSNSVDEAVAYLTAESARDAWKRAQVRIAAVFDLRQDDIYIFSLASFGDLIELGVSDDEDLRVFEMCWKDSTVSVWAKHPLFFTDDKSLLGKWLELRAHLDMIDALHKIQRSRP
jgi:hypothetical protein